MDAAPRALDHDWLAVGRRAAAGLREVLDIHPTSAERIVETGERGEGGDRTLVIDDQAEERVLREIARLHDEEGGRFTVVTEERGVVDFGAGGGPPYVVVDPIDGSLNAKRGLGHHALSIAVADGPTMADVVFGYVYDLGPGEEWTAERGRGATLNGVALAPPPERRTPDGRLEILAVESADPRWLALSSEALCTTTRRIRVMGSIAISLCQVAAARVDGMASLARSRAVDVAAAQLIVRESGGHVAFVGCPDGALDAPVGDVEAHHPVIAARTPQGLAELEAVPAVR